jgi:hypothetical protein
MKGAIIYGSTILSISLLLAGSFISKGIQAAAEEIDSALWQIAHSLEHKGKK